jgi:hypothetical protein
MQKQVLILLNTIINPNYLQHNNHLYKQDDELAMGAPTSALLAKVFI